MIRENHQVSQTTRKSGHSLLVAAIIVVGSIGCWLVAGCTSSEAIDQTPRADIITIAADHVFGELDRDPVQFKHDKHTAALNDRQDMCQTCHLTDEDGQLSQKFKRLTDDNAETVMDIYHDGCITCHNEIEDSVPVDCGGCHTSEPKYVSSRTPIGFDRSLHHRHSEASKKDCERCHHTYDEAQKKLVYVKGQEASCRDCHRDETQDNRLPLKTVAHTQCVGCHLTTPNSGPVECAGCHDAERRSQIAVVENPARFDRNQPDFLLLRAPLEELEHSKMKTVPFPHTEHENALPTCRVCHHETLKKCDQCHTLAGDTALGGVKLERAMHEMTSEHSCIGCHDELKTTPECAGCHAMMEQGRVSEHACAVCHSGPEPDRVLSVESRYRKMDQFRLSRSEATLSFADKDIPDTVRIGILADQYQEAWMPHRKIIEVLREKINNNGVAKHFHGSEDVLCQGCHHHSPTGSTPPECESCHGGPFNDREPFKPGLQGAFHQQCLSCHKEMGIGQPSDCVGCHAAK